MVSRQLNQHTLPKARPPNMSMRHSAEEILNRSSPRINSNNRHQRSPASSNYLLPPSPRNQYGTIPSSYADDDSDDDSDDVLRTLWSRPTRNIPTASRPIDADDVDAPPPYTPIDTSPSRLPKGHRPVAHSNDTIPPSPFRGSRGAPFSTRPASQLHLPFNSILQLRICRKARSRISHRPLVSRQRSWSSSV